MVFKIGDMVTLDYTVWAVHEPDEVANVKGAYGDAVFEITNTPNYREALYRLKVMSGGQPWVFGSTCSCDGKYLKAFTEEKAPTVSGENVMSITRKMFR